ncbi:hypothetical protein [Rugamonas sp.]|uniref:hypothetical protein n=1 Tax=Rugamonas sp. TaxID=1926287 RepID=UPI0025D0C0FE|nr:hypothetical protein [Rugamonas sp.]
MGFQFLHIEGYARSAGKGKAGGHTVASILAEASREPDACPHIAQPQAPVLLFGCPLADVAAEVEAWTESARDGIGRKLRKDGLCMLGGVVSAPDDMTQEQWEAMKRATLDYLNHDGRLLSVVEHGEESHRHIHFYKVAGAGERFETIHPGRAAANAAKQAGAAKGTQNAAYIKAMRAYQDDFFAEVGCRHGLTRLGPARRRLTRSAWQAEQQAAAASGAAMAKADAMTAAAVECTTIAATICAEADAAKASALAAADIAKAEADKATAALTLAQQRQKSNQLVVAKWTQERAVMVAMSKKIEVEKQSLDAFSKTGARIGAFIGALAGRAADALVAVMAGHKAKEAATAKALQLALEASANETARRLAAEQAAKAVAWQRDAIKEAASKAQREAEAERQELASVIEALQPARPLTQSIPTTRPRL